ncbi:hypothetical protein Bca52824_031373 [Brassica carinata]|uniref:At2g35280-like TPR domain-containing protein n=1 Tax=Brassica carinata TaxID=52824 RepID=A0A8X7SAJ5_BRACI|nr:hypothetical protein Bca52824_031373 [Brassica carinata]
MPQTREKSEIERLPTDLQTRIISRVGTQTRRGVPTFTRYHSLMERCLANGNLQAHYICGIHEYFEKNNRDVGLHHIRIAAEGSYDNAVYLYDVIMLSTGHPAIGEEMLDSLQWRVNKARADDCWRRIKRSIHRITVIQLESYITTYLNKRATITCHLDNFRSRCDECFYYKQIAKKKFIA